MQKVQSPQFLSLDKTEDQLVLVTFILVLVSFYFGLQSGILFAGLWAATGIGALLCIYFAFPNMWPYGLLLYVAYTISAFGTILLLFWFDKLSFFGISLSILVGIFLIAAAFYMAFHIVQHIKKTRDVNAAQGSYLPLGYWSIATMLFVLFSIISIYGWSIWVNSENLQLYLFFEPLLALLLVYILWLPDRSLDWSIKELPSSPATEFIVAKSKAIKGKIALVRNECPECGSKLKREKKTCPNCNNSQNFGWCVKSEAYVLPCSHCGSITLYGGGKCSQCGKTLTDSIVCNDCGKTYPVKEWVAQV